MAYPNDMKEYQPRFYTTYSLLLHLRASSQYRSTVKAMAFSMNPYTQGGWAQNEYGNAPSVYGALPSLAVSPSAPRSMQPDSVTFQFTQFRTTVLNCSVVSPQSRVAYRVITEATTPSCTLWKDNEGRVVAMAQWQPNATLELRGVTPRQRVRDWLRLAPDQRFV